MDSKDLQLKIKKMEYELFYFSGITKDKRRYLIRKKHEDQESLVSYRNNVNKIDKETDELRLAYKGATKEEQSKMSKRAAIINRRKTMDFDRILKLEKNREGLSVNFKNMTIIERRHRKLIISIIERLKEELLLKGENNA